MQTDQTVIPVYLQQQFVLTALRHRPTHQPQYSVCARQQTDGTAAELQPTKHLQKLYMTIAGESAMVLDSLPLTQLTALQ